ncbi:RNA-directed DNA polymerase, eukaryota, reverse transcriptase zinc-binding domain protein [Tanacetum coccineum]|uniref:RNA-directed DNA polymerase, eukaryota, reverse transcriptase zinc-binding domain protein n=1 Tax=Tanacetum coccineum TaxID=301880 RepID=A0ABQ5FZX2_9ASTR
MSPGNVARDTSGTKSRSEFTAAPQNSVLVRKRFERRSGALKQIEELCVILKDEECTKEQANHMFFVDGETMTKNLIFVTVIYASNYGVKRRQLWKELENQKIITHGVPWIILGDFNVTMKASEQSNGGSAYLRMIGVYSIVLIVIEVSGEFYLFSSKTEKNGYFPIVKGKCAGRVVGKSLGYFKEGRGLRTKGASYSLLSVYKTDMGALQVLAFMDNYRLSSMEKDVTMRSLYSRSPGRLQLIASILSSMQVFWIVVFLLPKQVIYDIERLLKGFLWCQGEHTKGKAKVSWNSCALSEFIGELGDMYDARLKNDCTISETVKDGKWCWPEDWNNEFDSLQHLQVPVILNEKEDYAVWVNNLRHEKKFKTGDVWKDICINDPKVEWYKMEIIIMPMNNNIWSIIRRLVCAAAVYFVWQERNKRMFGEEKRDSEELIKIVTESVRMKLMGLKVKDSRCVSDGFFCLFHVYEGIYAMVSPTNLYFVIKKAADVGETITKSYGEAQDVKSLNSTQTSDMVG